MSNPAKIGGVRLPFLVVAASLGLGCASAQLMPYAETFESFDEVGPDLLLGDDWLVFGNAYESSGAYVYPYGPFDAPNSGGGFCNIATGEGGAEQGTKVLTIYSDYNNAEMAAPPEGLGRIIEGNTFREFIIGAVDVGATWTFSFDVKRGNLEGASTNLAFIKVLDPANGFALSAYETFDVATLPDVNWATESLEVTIGDWEGQILQIGFLATATAYEGSGAFYDNLSFTSPDYVKPPGPTIVSAGIVAGEFIVIVESREGFDYSLQKSLDPAGPYTEVDALAGDGFELELFDDDLSSPRAFYIVEETEELP